MRSTVACAPPGRPDDQSGRPGEGGAQRLLQSAPLSNVASKRGPAIERAAIDAAPDPPVPWLLALIPVGSFVMAGLLVLLLARFVAVPTVPPSPESSLDETADFGMSADEVEGDAWGLPFGPAYER